MPHAKYCAYCGHDVVLNNSGPHYYITRVIKEGGQGSVYEAVGEDGQTYAVKEMIDRFDNAKDRDEAVRRFEAEARLLQRLKHPRVPRVYAYFNDEGKHYLAMEFIHGEDLEDVVAREGPIAEERVLDWVDQISDLLGHLHDNGMIYRDMKPSNVMIDRRDGGLKLIDFGIAKVFQPNTRGTQIGTPGYAPPEQYQGLATRASDIYALGATMHHLLTGRDPTNEPPFTYPPVRNMQPRVSQRTADAVAQALEMKAEDRFQAVADFRAALGLTTTQVAVAPPPTARMTTPPRTAPPSVPPTTRTTPPQPPPSSAPQKRSRGGTGRTIIIALAVLALLALGITFALFGLSGGDAPSGPTATPQTLIAQPFTAELTIQVAPGASDAELMQAFIEVYRVAARAECNCEPQIEGDLVYLQPPEKLSEDVTIATYRASLQGTILVPQQ